MLDGTARVIFTAGRWVYALDAATGKPIGTFGEAGRAVIETGGTVAGAIFKHVLVVPGFERDVYGYEPAWGLPSMTDRAEIVRIMTAEAPQGGSAPPSPGAIS